MGTNQQKISEKWQEALSRNGGRITLPRQIILEVIAASQRPLSPQEVHAQAVKRLPSIGLVTVYRTIDKLVDLKRAITGCIMSVQDMEYQSLLEKRYLCLMTWEQIAAENGCSVRNIHMMHGEALKMVIVPENLH